jgi:hypothetical protein
MSTRTPAVPCSHSEASEAAFADGTPPCLSDKKGDGTLSVRRSVTSTGRVASPNCLLTGLEGSVALPCHIDRREVLRGDKVLATGDWLDFCRLHFFRINRVQD